MIATRQTFPQWAVLPSILPHHGDMRRNFAPYVLTGGVSYGCLNTAQDAADKLRKLGHPCHVDLVEDRA